MVSKKKIDEKNSFPPLLRKYFLDPPLILAPNNFFPGVVTAAFLLLIKPFLLQPNEKYERSAFIPCVEPESETAIITKTPKELYESGDYQYIPFMTGLTNGEGIVYLDG